MTQPPLSAAAPDGERLAGVDMSWLRMEQPTNLMTITGILALDAPISIDVLRRLVEERFASIPRFRQRVVRRGRKAWWVEDGEVDLEAHVKALTLPAPGDKAALEKTVGELMSRPLDYDRPMWCFHLIEDYRGGGVIVVRVHHSFGDGIALMMVLLSLAEVDETWTEDDAHTNPIAALFQPGASGVTEEALEQARTLLPEGMKLMVRPATGGVPKSKLRFAAKATAALGRLTFRPADPKTVFKGALGRDKLVAWSDAIPLADVKALKEAMGATLNDVLLTAMTGGLRHYLESRGQPVDGLNFRAAVPVSLRRVEKLSALGNQFGLVFLSLPVGIADPGERLTELRRRMLALKGSLEAGVVLAILYGMGMSPEAVQKFVVWLFGKKATAVMTNVPGPRQPLYLAGRKINDILFWVPQSGRVALGISIISYDGKVRLGVTTDAGLAPDPGVIIEGFHRELEEMERRAGVGMAAASTAG